MPTWKTSAYIIPSEVSVEKMTEVLKDAGFEVVNVWQTKAEDAVK